MSPLPTSVVERADSFRLAILVVMSAAVVVTVSPFVIIRLVHGELYEALTNALVVGGVGGIALYAWLSRRVGTASVLLALFYTSATVALIYERDVLVLLWMLPIALANLFILSPWRGLLLNALALVALAPLHGRYGNMDIAAFLGSFVLVNALATALSCSTALRHDVLEKVERQLREKTHFLAERVKELRCINSVSELLQQRDVALEQILEAVIEVIPSGWQHADAAGACIELEGRAYRTERFGATPHLLSEPILLDGTVVGRVAVSYPSAMAIRGKDAFLPEERSLLSMIAFQLGRIVERRQHDAELNRLLNEDRLTGLLSRMGFVARLEEKFALGTTPGNSGWLVVLNLKHFNDVNQVYGFESGSRLLVAIGRRLSALAGEYGCVGRVHGDQFALLLCNALNDSSTDSRGAINIAAQLDSVFTAPFELGAHQVKLDISMGLAPFNADCGGGEEAMRRAQLALSIAREYGDRHWSVHSEALDDAVQQRIQITERLRRAIDEDAFELHYQPKVRLDDGSIVSAEGLLRWHDPSQGMQPPAAFIALAERSQLIVPIGAWVINSACQQLRQWQEARLPPVNVAVNLSVIQFSRSDLVETVRRIVGESGIDPSLLSLEITESAFAREPDMLLRQLHALRALGVRLSLDDFGTGYSSLAHLNEYPFDEIKIDRSFVQRCASQVHSRRIVQMVVRVANALGSEVVAEGIETAEQARMMQQLGCHVGQGFYFARPMAGGDLHRLLASGATLPLLKDRQSATS